jgi:hypothetical protein
VGLVTERRPASEPNAVHRTSAGVLASRSRRLAVVGCALVILAGVAAWLWEDVTSRPAVYVVGDSISALSRHAISTALQDSGYQPTIEATPGAKIVQAETVVTTLAQQQPWAWVIELGTDDAGAKNAAWPQPFLAEWKAVSSAACVIYVTISPRAGPVAVQIDSSIEKLAQTHSNVHVLDWGRIEYENPAWVYFDGIHPTPQGQAELAGLEMQELSHAC